MAKEQKQAQGATPNQSSALKTLKGVKIVKVDDAETIQKAYKRRFAKDPNVTMKDIFVHIEIKLDDSDKVYGGLSQTVGILGQDDWNELLEAFAKQTPVDIQIRDDAKARQTGNYFFYVKHDVSVADIFKQVDETKPIANRTPMASIGDVIDIDE